MNLLSVVVVIIVATIYSCHCYKCPLRVLRWSVRSRSALDSTGCDQISTSVLRKVDSWACVKNCGACCKLGPLDSRPDLQSYLSAKQHELYVSMIGDDDWCKYFDKESRLCGIYETRPQFCRVDKNNFKTMFNIAEEEFSDFSTFCCQENISDVYGEDSPEMKVFEDAIDKLQDVNEMEESK